MRAILSVFLFAVTVWSQSAYFLNAQKNSHSVQSLTDSDIHFNLKTNIDTLPAGSTMVCENTCRWEYDTVFSGDSSYSIEYCRDYIVHISFTYSFFDPLNREFHFSLTGPVDSIWGDTLATPGYDKTIYARVKGSACYEKNVDISNESFSIYQAITDISKQPFSVSGLSIIGTLPDSPSVSFSRAVESGSLKGCPAASRYPQGNWTWLYTTKATTTSSGLGGPRDTIFPSPQNSVTMTIKEDSIYIQSGDNLKSDTISKLSHCSGTLHAFDTTYKFTYMGPTILCLKQTLITPNTMHPASTNITAYYISFGASIDTLVTGATLTAPSHRITSPFFLNFTSNQSVHLVYSLRKKSRIRLNLFTLDGKNVWKLSEALKPKGAYSESIHLPSHLPNGCYLAELSADGRSTAAKINLIR